jgi:hypothetical protein
VGWRLPSASVVMHRVDNLPRALPHCPAPALSGVGGGAMPLRGQWGVVREEGGSVTNEEGVIKQHLRGDAVVHWAVCCQAVLPGRGSSRGGGGGGKGGHMG